MEATLRPFILGTMGRRKIEYTIKYRKKLDGFTWDIKGPLKRIMRIRKNATRFHVVSEFIMDRKTIQKVTKKLANSESDFKKLRDMMLNQTSCEVVYFGPEDTPKPQKAQQPS